MIPLPPKEDPQFIKIVEEVSFPNRKGYNSTVRWRPSGPLRKIMPGDYDLYGRAVEWYLQGKIEFVDRPFFKPQMKGKAKVE